MEIIELGLKSIAVSVTRKLEIGKKVHMIPSDGFLGIDTGTAVIKDIVMENHVNQSEYAEDILANSDILDTIGYINVNEVAWVVYEYVDTEDNYHIDFKLQTLPLEIFIDHSHPKF